MSDRGVTQAWRSAPDSTALLIFDGKAQPGVSPAAPVQKRIEGPDDRKPAIAAAAPGRDKHAMFTPPFMAPIGRLPPHRHERCGGLRKRRINGLAWRELAGVIELRTIHEVVPGRQGTRELLRLMRCVLRIRSSGEQRNAFPSHQEFRGRAEDRRLIQLGQRVVGSERISHLSLIADSSSEPCEGGRPDRAIR